MTSKTKSLMKATISDLARLIKTRGSKERIELRENTIIDSISEFAKEKDFFEVLPAEEILKIIELSKIEDTELLCDIISKMSEKQADNSVLLLNVINPGNTSFEDCIKIISTFKSSKFCVRIGELFAENMKLPEVDYSREIEEFKQKQIEEQNKINKRKHICYGIDLGTTNSCISVFNAMPVDFKTNPVTSKTIPSVVSFLEYHMLVGEAALNQIGTKPANTFYCVKRLIGRKFNEKCVTEDRKSLSYPIYKDSKNPEKIVLKVATERYNNGKDAKGNLTPCIIEPDEISAHVLAYLKNIVCDESVIPTDNVVITVPGNFNEYQKRATMDAAKIAGLKPLDVISEAVATCITHVCSKERNDKLTRILVYDYGSGTLDASLVEVKGGNFTVIATAGDSHCGGTDIDNYLLQKKIEEFEIKTRIDLSGNSEDISENAARSRALLRNACEDAKINISNAYDYPIIIPNFYKNGDTMISFNSAIYNIEIETYVSENREKLIAPIKSVLQESKITINKVDTLIFVGGSSNIPAVKKLIKDKFKVRTFVHVNKEQAIATGAAIYGAYILKNTDQQYKDLMICDYSDLKITDVTPMNISINMKDDTLETLIPRNAKLPAESEWKKYLSRTVSFNVYEGNGPKPNQCFKVGTFNIECNNKSNRFFAKVVATKAGIAIRAVTSDTVSEYSQYEDLTFKSTQFAHTEEEICKLQNRNKNFRREKENLEVSYIEKIFFLCSKYLPIIVSITKDRKKKDEMKAMIGKIKNKFRSMNGTIPLSKKDFLQAYEEIENEIKRIVPEYKGNERIKKLVEETTK